MILSSGVWFAWPVQPFFLEVKRSKYLIRIRYVHDSAKCWEGLLSQTPFDLLAY